MGFFHASYGVVVWSSQQQESFAFLLAGIRPFLPFPSRPGASDEHDASHQTRSTIQTIR